MLTGNLLSLHHPIYPLIKYLKNNIFIGGDIEQICEETDEDLLADRTILIRPTRRLLAAITRVLLLADIVVVKQLLLAKDKVMSKTEPSMESTIAVSQAIINLFKPVYFTYI